MRCGACIGFNMPNVLLERGQLQRGSTLGLEKQRYNIRHIRVRRRLILREAYTAIQFMFHRHNTNSMAKKLTVGKLKTAGNERRPRGGSNATAACNSAANEA